MLCGMLCSFELIVACWWCCLLLGGDVHNSCCVGSASLLSFLANNRMSYSYSMVCLIAKVVRTEVTSLKYVGHCVFSLCIYNFVIFIKIPDALVCMTCCLKIMVVSTFFCHWWKIKINFLIEHHWEWNSGTWMLSMGKYICFSLLFCGGRAEARWMDLWVLSLHGKTLTRWLGACNLNQKVLSFIVWQYQRLEKENSCIRFWFLSFEGVNHLRLWELLIFGKRISRYSHTQNMYHIASAADMAVIIGTILLKSML